LLTDNVYTFEIQEELIRNKECDSWKEIPVKVDASTKTTDSEQHVTDDDDDDGQKQHHDVSDAAAAAAAAEPSQTSQSEPQLSRESDFMALLFGDCFCFGVMYM